MCERLFLALIDYFLHLETLTPCCCCVLCVCVCVCVCVFFQFKHTGKIQQATPTAYIGTSPLHTHTHTHTHTHFLDDFTSCIRAISVYLDFPCHCLLVTWVYCCLFSFFSFHSVSHVLFSHLLRSSAFMSPSDHIICFFN